MANARQSKQTNTYDDCSCTEAYVNANVISILFQRDAVFTTLPRSFVQSYGKIGSEFA